jgi:hypothetical protein
LFADEDFLLRLTDAGFVSGRLARARALGRRQATANAEKLCNAFTPNRWNAATNSAILGRCLQESRHA